MIAKCHSCGLKRVLVYTDTCKRCYRDWYSKTVKSSMIRKKKRIKIRRKGDI